MPAIDLRHAKAVFHERILGVGRVGYRITRIDLQRAWEREGFFLGGGGGAEKRRKEETEGRKEGRKEGRESMEQLPYSRPNGNHGHGSAGLRELGRENHC